MANTGGRSLSPGIAHCAHSGPQSGHIWPTRTDDHPSAISIDVAGCFKLRYASPRTSSLQGETLQPALRKIRGGCNAAQIVVGIFVLPSGSVGFFRKGAEPHSC